MRPYRRTRLDDRQPPSPAGTDRDLPAHVRGREGPPTLVYTVMVDFPDVWCWRKEIDAVGPWVGRDVGYGKCWNGRHPLSRSLIDAFADWQSGWAEGLSSVAPTADEYALFPWRVFHQQGWALCQRLKQELGDAARVLYSKPCEDPWYFENEYAEFAIDGSFTFLTDRRASSADPQGSTRPDWLTL